MDAIQLNNVMRHHMYASRGISVDPYPPRVGVATTLALYLKNAGSLPMTISHIEAMVAQFGMGVPWEKLADVGPFSLPADARNVEEVKMQWTPLKAGHRCIRAFIHIETLPQPLRIGRNLDIIDEPDAQRMSWRVPFRLGNPEEKRQPIMLTLDGNAPETVDAHVLVNGHQIGTRQPIWLEAGQQVEAMLLLRARTHGIIESVNNVEATIDGRFLDGIQVVLHRPAPMARPNLQNVQDQEQREQEVIKIA